MKMSITVPDQLFERMSEYNKTMGVPKSTLVQMAVAQYLDAQKMLETLPDMMRDVRRLMEEKQND